MNKLVPTTSLLSITLALGLSMAACKKKQTTGEATKAATAEKNTVQNIGSDTMVNVAQAWAEEYAKVDDSVSVEVSGGGSGIGIAALLNGTADLANASRKVEEKELAKAKETGNDPKEFLVGFDALSIYVHKDNPLTEITVEQLGDIYREGGKLEKWSQLGVKSIPGAKGDEIVRVSRQNNSGTYHYFREAILGTKSDFKQGSLDMNGSKDVVELVGKTPGSIGYSGLGYATPDVRIIKVAKKKGEPAIQPSIATTLDKTYPIARPMFMYTPGEPPAHVKKYLDWILSPAGQAIVEKNGYVPLQAK